MLKLSRLNPIIAFIQQLFRPPTFPEPEKTRAAHWLYLFLWLFIGLLLLLTIPLFFSSNQLGAFVRLRFIYIQSALILVFCGGLILVRAGFVRSISVAILLLVYGGTVYAHVYVFQTIHDPSVIGYFALMPLA
ncbi:MAG TPA: hypothetical protein VNK95_25025, partial [Caldilineaceae bacterium]|nr:hypothetical protein [Caldilineaceae bacterium]